MIFEEENSSRIEHFVFEIKCQHQAMAITMTAFCMM